MCTCTVEPAMSSFFYEQLTFYGRSLNKFSPKKYTKMNILYGQALVMNGHFSCVLKVAALHHIAGSTLYKFATPLLVLSNKYNQNLSTNNKQ